MDTYYMLDNAAKLFPAVANSSNSATFRVSIILKERIDPALLQNAVDISVKRFPMLCVKIRKGLFWNFFDENKMILLVQKESKYPCHDIHPHQNHGHFLRVLYFQKRISLEVFHALTDGTGALEFLKTIVYEYLILSGRKIEAQNLIRLPESMISKYEMEDSYLKYDRGIKYSKEEKLKKAFRIEGTPLEPFGHNVIQGVLSASGMNQAAKQKNATITEYLVALFLYSIYAQNMRYGIYHDIITIAVPVNLRKKFPSKTLRNFFCVIYISVPARQELNFEKILAEVVCQMKEKTKQEFLERAIAENVRLEKNLMVKFVPLFIKQFILKLSFKNRAEKRRTATLTNLGNILVPEEMKKDIDFGEAILYPTIKSPVNCSVLSMNDRLNITFTRNIAETDIIRYFFRFLADETGLDITVYYNDWGMEE